jgi:hypothetical protein
MGLMKRDGRGQVIRRVVPALLTCFFLFGANYAMDIAMARMGIDESKTIVNDLIIGVLGALAVYYYLSASYENLHFESAKERILLIGELNLRIRESLGVVTSSAMSDDRVARLRGIDEAIDRIDDILCDFQADERGGGKVKAASGSGRAGNL